LSFLDQRANNGILNDVEFKFTTQSLLSFGNNISILLPASYFTGKVSPTGTLCIPATGGCVVPGSAALVNCALSDRSALTSSWLQIDCVINVASLAIGIYKITFAAGELTTGPATSVSATGLQIMTSLDGLSAGVRTEALFGIRNVSMILASSDQFAFQTTNQTVSFFFSTMISFRASIQTISVGLPERYFIGKSFPQATIIPPSGTPFVSLCTLTGLKIECPTSGSSLPLGSFQLRFAAGELTLGSVFKLIGFKGAV